MEEWKEYNIGNLCSKVCSGGTPSSRHSEYYDGNIPWLNTKEINFNRIYSTEKCITEEGLNNSSAKWIEENSVIVAMYGATAGKAAIAKIPLTTNQACCNLTINSSLADYNFVYYHLCNKFTELASLANGGAQQNLNAQIIKEFPIPLPSLNEQRKIVAILKSLDDKIEVNRKINENLEQQAQALFKSWFVDFEPFKDGEFVESELGGIPKGWRVISFKDVCTNITDGVHNTVKDNPHGEYYLLSCKNIKGGTVSIGDNERKIDKQTFEKLRKRTKLQKGDILLSSVGTIGEMVFLNENPDKYEFQRSVAIIKPNEEAIEPIFLFYSMMNQRDVIVHSAHGAVQQCLFISDVSSFTTIYPPRDIMGSFASIAMEIQNKKAINEQESRRLATLRDTLLTKLMSGELKVNA